MVKGDNRIPSNRGQASYCFWIRDSDIIHGRGTVSEARIPENRGVFLVGEGHRWQAYTVDKKQTALQNFRTGVDLFQYFS